MSQRPDYGKDTYVGHGRLQDRRALITGADSGIGRAVALAFAREGADVCFSHLEAEADDAQETRRVVQESGRRAVPIAGDLVSPKFAGHLVEEAREELGGLDILVNNASVQLAETSSFEEYTPERLDYTLRVNVLAMFEIVRVALRHMEAGACIINVSSIEAYDPQPEILDYATTKGAIITYSKGLSRHLAPRGIRVNVVAPGPIWTPIIPQSFEPMHTAKHGQKAPLGRPGQPAEVAPAFVFLASDESSYVTGEVLGVTGGLLMP